MKNQQLREKLLYVASRYIEDILVSCPQGALLGASRRSRDYSPTIPRRGKLSDTDAACAARDGDGSALSERVRECVSSTVVVDMAADYDE